MPFNVDSFLSTAGARGVLKTTQTEVTFILPPAFDSDPDAGFSNLLAQEQSMWADATAIPGVTLQSMKFRRYGYGMFDSAVFTPNFSDVQVRFIADASLDNWRLFWSWINKTVNLDSSGGMPFTGNTVVASYPLAPYETAYQDDVSSTLFITTYAATGDEAMTVILNNATPTAISEIKTDWGDTADVARFIVNFNIQDFNIT